MQSVFVVSDTSLSTTIFKRESIPISTYESLNVYDLDEGI